MSEPDIIRPASTSSHLKKVQDGALTINGSRYLHQPERDRFVKASAVPRLLKEEKDSDRRQHLKLITKMEQANRGYY